MKDWSIYVSWYYLLILLNIGMVIRIGQWFFKQRHIREVVVNQESPGVFRFKSRQPDWVQTAIYFTAFPMALWAIEYYPVLTESTTVLYLIYMFLFLKQRKLGIISLDAEAIKTSEGNQDIHFKRIKSIKFASDHIEIWTKSLIQHYHEFTEPELGDGWEDFKKELLLAVRDKDWITVTTTVKSPESAIPPPRSFPSPESETHTGK